MVVETYKIRVIAYELRGIKSLVRDMGLEPTRLSAQEPKSCAAASYANPAYEPAYIYEKRYSKTSVSSSFPK